MTDRAPGRLQRLRRSLGLRLVLLFMLLALAMSAVFLYGMQRALATGWNSVLRPLVSDYVDRLAAEIGSPPDPARAQALEERLPLSVRIEGPLVQRVPQARGWPRRRHDDSGFDHGESLFTRTTADGHRLYFGLGETRWASRPRAIGWFTLFALLLLTVAAYGYVRHLVRPLRDIRAGAQRFGRAEFDQPIPVRRHDELGELAEQVNTMARDIRGLLDAKRGLLLAVSHELRSPLTRARLNAELVDESVARDALLADLATMRDLISDLLEGERLAGGHAALQRRPTDLNALVRQVAHEHFAAAGLRLELDPGLPSIELDAARVRLLLRNLLDNAVRHSAAAIAAPRVSTFIDHGQWCLHVRDFGAGVPAEQLPQLVEAFYRADAARERRTGGVGLGLYLCKLVALSHGGVLQIANAQPGLSVTLRVPLNRA